MNDDDRKGRKLLYDHDDVEPFGNHLFLLPKGTNKDQDLALKAGLLYVVEASKVVVHKYCRQSLVLSLDPDATLDASYEVDVTWEFDNLLGAMYLQMYWLVAAGGTLARCGVCGRMIARANSNKGGRQTRRDKKF